MIYVNHEDFVKAFGTFPEELLLQIRETIKLKFKETYQIGDISSFIAVSLTIDILMNLRPEAREVFIKNLYDNMMAVIEELKARESNAAT